MNGLQHVVWSKTDVEFGRFDSSLACGSGFKLSEDSFNGCSVCGDSFNGCPILSIWT